MKLRLTGYEVAREIFGLIALGLALMCAWPFFVSGCGNNELPKVGERAVTGEQLAVTVEKIRFMESYTMAQAIGGVTRPTHPGDIFALVDLAVENRGKAPQQLDTVSLFVQTGRVCAPPLVVLAPDALSVYRQGQTIGSGEKVRSTAIIEVPAGGLLDRLRIGSSPPIEFSLDLLPAEAPAQGGELPKLGETARSGGLEFSVHAAGLPGSLSGGKWTLTEPEGIRLIVLDVSVKNDSGKHVHGVNPESIMLVAGNRYYWASDLLAGGLPPEEKLKAGDLAPGETARGLVVVGIPNTLVPERVRYDVEVVGPPLEIDITGAR